MTREIKTPADAVPHEAYVEITPESGHPSTEYRKFFTAAEVAQIAEAYAEVYCTENLSRSDKLKARAWRAKFSEWGKQT